MIKVENIEVFNFEGAIRGMRNPLASHKLSDSEYKFIDDEFGGSSVYCIGAKDLKLMNKLYEAGAEHAKYLRQIFVSMDITAPIYFNQELDTYKIGVTRNSYSFQHKGVSKPFSITDFAIDDTRIYDILEPVKIKKDHPLIYPYETKEFKILSLGDRTYKVYRNGKIISNEYEVQHAGDNRIRHFKEKELKPTQNNGGYWMLNLGGKRYLRKALVHRIVAETWLPNNNANLEVNHIDGNKGNNSIENLEWITHAENEKHAHITGLKDYTQSLAWRYNAYKVAHKMDYFDEQKIQELYKQGIKQIDIANKFCISQGQVGAICNNIYDDDMHYLFTICMLWEKIINELNRLRDLYLETEDYNYFRAIRQLLPMGYKQRYTITMSYANVMNIINQRSNHKLKEWRDYCKILRKLPYVEEIRGDANGK